MSHILGDGGDNMSDEDDDDDDDLFASDLDGKCFACELQTVAWKHAMASVHAAD